MVDLHHTLPQIAADPAKVWEVVADHRSVIDVVGSPTEVLDPPASALLIALHAAHHGPDWGGTDQDLERALEVLDDSVWEEARDMAIALGAERQMGTGLGLNDVGARLARRLGLDPGGQPGT